MAGKTLSTHEEAVLVCLDDGRAGHRQQSHALVQALQQHRPLQLHTLQPLSFAQVLLALLGWRRPTDWPAHIDLMVGCGHACHWTLLAAKTGFAIRTVLLMRPSLPLSAFDYVIAPEHDALAQQPSVFATRGALAPAPLTDAGVVQRDQALILLGGPSRHGRWDNDAIIEQVLKLLARYPDWQWIISNSPRSPADLLEGIAAQLPRTDRLHLHDYRRQAPDWLAQQLLRSHSVWISPDSASMVYQALTAGCAVGLFDLPAPPASRVRRGLSILVDQGLLIDWQGFQQGHTPQPPAPPFREADAAAAWLATRLGWDVA